MASFIFFGSILSAFITYVSTAVFLKKIKTGEDEFTAVAIGSIAFAFFIGCFIFVIKGL